MLVALSADKLEIETGREKQSLLVEQVMWVDFPEAKPPSEKAAVWIELVDGSKLQAQDFTAANGTARIELTSGAMADVPTRAIHAVRLREQSTPELANQWREIAGSAGAGDVVVIRKASMRTIEQGDNDSMTVIEEALDQLEGTIHDVTADRVRFEVDGEKVDIRREKLEGFIYYQPTKRDDPSPLCRLTDIGGSVWLLREFKFDGDRLEGATIAGVRGQWPVTALRKIDFSVGNVVFLSDLEPDSGAGELAVSLQPAGMTYKFGRIFRVRASPPLGADSFRIGGARFDNGLSLHSPVTLVYRVPGGFRWLRAVAGIDDSVIAPGQFELIILGDGKELVRHSFSNDLSAGSRRPVPIDLDVSAVRRITIVLNPADGQDIGDQLDLCEARFTK